MSSNTSVIPRRPLAWLIAGAAAAAFFAAGIGVARATMDDDGDDSETVAPDVLSPGISQGGGAPGPNTPAIAGEDKGADAGRSGLASYAGCRAPLPAGVVTASGIDPAKAGFVPALPGEAFAALSASIGAVGDCDKDGNATSGDLTLDSAWTHTASGLDAYISQRATSERVANVLRQDSATFWDNGYVFTVGVNSYHILPAATRDAENGSSPATSSGATDGVTRTAPASTPVSPNPDPRAAEVLRELIAQLAPGADLRCFWTLGTGDWTSLATVGVGDPRSAIPAGYTEQGVQVTSFAPPADGCDASLKPRDGFSFNANWQKQDADNFGHIGVSVYGYGGSAGYPGQIGEWGANWANNGLQFSVYAKAEKPLGIDAIRVIAKALDSQFNEACFIKERQLTDADLPGLGFSPAKAPDGYTLDASSMIASEIGAGCEKPEGWEPSYNLNWTFTKGADTINASANRYGSSQVGDGSGYQSTNSLSWVSANGTNFSVNAYSRGINPTVPKDDLIAVAKSIDPAFDISKLKEAPDVEKPAVDLPERSAR